MLAVAVPTRDQHGTAGLVVVERPFVDSVAVEREEVAQPGREAATNSFFRDVVAAGGNTGGDSGECEIDGGLAPSSVHRDYCTVRRMFPNTAGNPLAESSFYVHHFTVLIARGDRHGEHVLDSTLFDRLRARSSATSTSNDGKLKP